MQQVEKVLGIKKFVTVYALAGIAGNALSCIVNPTTPVRRTDTENNSATGDIELYIYFSW